MVFLSALLCYNPENPHITTCHTMKPSGRIHIAEERITWENIMHLLPRRGTWVGMTINGQGGQL